MAREILKYPHPALSRVSDEISEITAEIRVLAEEMAELMYAKRGVGLAANQVGECCRLIAVDISGPDERTDLMYLVNPVIVSQEGSITDEEGCLSVVNFRSNVTRSEKVLVKAKNLEGKDVEIPAEGLLAVCLQHEIDHLDGKLFIDRVSRLKRALYDSKVKKWMKAKKSG